AAWLAGVPVIVHTPHGHVFYGHFGRLVSWLFLQAERLLATCTSRMVALTEAERDEHLERGVGRNDHFAVIPSGIDLEQFKRVAGAVGRRPKGVDCPPDALVAGSVGWLTPIKGHRSLNEGMGRALVEAMAAARPVIATRVGGIPAFVKDRQNGLLVPPGDSTALAAAIAELLSRPDWAKELGAAASQSIGARFGIPAM